MIRFQVDVSKWLFQGYEGIQSGTHYTMCVWRLCMSRFGSRGNHNIWLSPSHWENCSATSAAPFTSLLLHYTLWRALHIGWERLEWWWWWLKWGQECISSPVWPCGNSEEFTIQPGDLFFLPWSSHLSGEIPLVGWEGRVGFKGCFIAATLPGTKRGVEEARAAAGTCNCHWNGLSLLWSPLQELQVF